VLKGAGLAAAAGAAALVVTGKAQPAGATVTALDIDVQNTGIGNTELKYTGSEVDTGVIFLANETAAAPTDSEFPAAISGRSSGDKTHAGVYGYTEGAGGFGVIGVANAQNAVGVFATASTGASSILAEANGTARALVASTLGTSQAVWAHIDNSANTKDSVRAENDGTGAGIYATSAKGAGGKFGGKTAQIQLVPSTAASHPASGSAGQLFVDSSKRLWYCRGGSNWAQLA
jgi:hypothetical protein